MEKVSRPDRTGVWVRGGIPLNWNNISPIDDLEVYSWCQEPATPKGTAIIANQAIEKMIASAREKGR